MYDDKGYDLGLDYFAEFCRILKGGYYRGIVLQNFAKFITGELIVCTFLHIFAKTIEFYSPPFLLHFRHSDPLECYWMINRNAAYIMHYSPPIYLIIPYHKIIRYLYFVLIYQKIDNNKIYSLLFYHCLLSYTSDISYVYDKL